MSIQLSVEALLTRDLINCHTPSGRERAAADCLVQAFQTLNYDEAYIDAAGNAVGILRCGESPETGPTVMLNGHIDTVALGDESLWAQPPLSGAVSEEDDGPRMWGRGACDMKAAVACMVYAAKDAAEAGFNGTLMVTGVVQEEVGGFGARHLATEQHADVVILGEPSKLKLMVGHRGRLEVHAYIRGKIAHAANNSLGLNALYEAAEALKTLETLELPTGGRLNGSSLTPTNLVSSPDSHNVVPGEARLVIAYRNIPEDAPEAVLARLQAAMPKARLEVLTEHATSENGEVTIDYPHIAPAYLTPLDSPYLDTARQTLQDVLPSYGVNFEEDVWWFCTDAPYLAEMSNGKGGNAVIIGFGPGEEERAHTTHENVPLKHLEVARATYRDLCLAYAREHSSQASAVSV